MLRAPPIVPARIAKDVAKFNAARFALDLPHFQSGGDPS